MTTDNRIPIEPLIAFGTSVYKQLGASDEEAHLIADSLVQADLWGHQSHGVMRLPWYAARLESGVMRAVTEPKTLVDAGAITLIDGQDGIGQTLAQIAVKEAVKRAKEHGVGVVSLRNSNHFGTAMYHTRLAAQEGCIGFLTTNGISRLGAGGRNCLATIRSVFPPRLENMAMRSSTSPIPKWRAAKFISPVNAASQSLKAGH